MNFVLKVEGAGAIETIQEKSEYQSLDETIDEGDEDAAEGTLRLNF